VSASSVRNSRYIAILAIASVFILIIGVTVRRAIDTGKAEPPPPSESDLLRLARLSQRRSLEDMAGYLRSIAEQAQRSIVWMPQLSTTGVVWPSGLVVTTRSSDTVKGAAISGPHMPLVGVERADVDGEAVTLRADSLRSGEWIVAAWRDGATLAYESGHVAGTTTVPCQERSTRAVVTTIAVTRSMAGAGVFDLDGRLIAVVASCGETLMAAAVADVDAILEEGRTGEQRLLTALGLRVAPLTSDETIYFKRPQGTIVREIWDGTRAAEAALRPGDIVRSVNDVPVTTPAEVQALMLSAGDRLVVGVERRGAPNIVALTTNNDETPQSQGAGIIWRSPILRYPIDGVIPHSPAARAGIQPGDVVLRIDQVEPRNLTEVARRLTANDTSRPAFLEVQRGRRRWGVLLR
jgi:S1-C subfamily serine protease